MIRSHKEFLHQAFLEAKKRRGFCAPNPAVGAVVVKNNKIISVGRHYAAGKPHAEVEALSKLTEAEAEGAILYVTLEPCCHYGRTPPCTELVIKKKLQAVFYGYRDPNPTVAGKGEAQLQQAGIPCELIASDAIAEFYRSYHYFWQHGRPWITAKLALSQDGKIAQADGSPALITGEACRIFTHEHRLAADAILTTAQTVLADNPKMNVRLNNEAIKKPVYILDRQGRLTGNEQIFQTAEVRGIFCDEFADVKHYHEKNISTIKISTDAHGLDLAAVIQHFGKLGLHDVWIEAGGELFYSLYKQKLLNEAYLYFSNKKLGEEAKAAFPSSFDITHSGAHVKKFALGDDFVWNLLFV